MHDIFVGVEENDLREVDAAIVENPDAVRSIEGTLGMTALHLAAGDGNLRMVNHLLAKPGIDAAIRDKLGRSSIDLAIGIGRDDVVDAISRVLYPASFSAPTPTP